ncbi:MAG TPA: hypothetical protein VEV63_18100, partial [Streptosporangiaceae bacterium]|nr:hypothetical protein [Streptosporangiaceae bacterium]
MTLPRPMKSPAVTSIAADQTVIAPKPNLADIAPKADKPATPDSPDDRTAPWPAPPAVSVESPQPVRADSPVPPESAESKPADQPAADKADSPAATAKPVV